MSSGLPGVVLSRVVGVWREASVDVKTDDTRSEGQKPDLLAELEGKAREGGRGGN